jgi:hypothetical protein
MRHLATTACRAAADVDYLPTPGAHCGHCCWAPRCAAAVDRTRLPGRQAWNARSHTARNSATQQ